MGVGATPNRCTYLLHLSTFLKNLGGTRSELFSTRPEPNSTQRVVPSRIELPFGSGTILTDPDLPCKPYPLGL
jgi:hypothetical protein